MAHQEDTLYPFIKRYNPIPIDTGSKGIIWEIDTPTFILKDHPQIGKRILLTQSLKGKAIITRVLKKKIERGEIAKDRAAYLILDLGAGIFNLAYLSTKTTWQIESQTLNLKGFLDT